MMKNIPMAEQQHRIQVDVNACKLLMCQCGQTEFVQRVQFRKAPVVLVGQDMFVPVQVFQCPECHTVYLSPEALIDSDAQ